MESYALSSPRLRTEPVPRLARVISFPRSISVCHIVSAEMWAGAEAQIAMLLAELSAATQVRLSAVVLGEGQLAAKIREAGIDCLCIPDASGRFLECYRRARAFLSQRRTDVIHSHKSKENMLAVMLARSLGIPHLVRTQHGKPEPRTIKDRVVYWLEAITARRVDSYISVSSELAHFLRQRAGEERIRIIPNAIDLNGVASALSADQAKQRLGIDAATPVVGIAARLQTVKRIDLFLEAAGTISREIPRAMFVVAGEGRQENGLRELARTTGLEARVRFLGHRTDICDVLRAFDVLLITSDHEGLPTVLLESMALGVPAVARAVGGTPEVIEDGNNGLLIHAASASVLADACVSLLNNRALRERIVSQAVKTVQLYSSRQNADAVLRLYGEVVFGSP